MFLYWSKLRTLAYRILKNYLGVWPPKTVKTNPSYSDHRQDWLQSGDSDLYSIKCGYWHK